MVEFTVKNEGQSVQVIHVKAINGQPATRMISGNQLFKTFMHDVFHDPLHITHGT